MINPTYAEIGLRIREMRESKKIKREELALLAGISTQFLGQIETGRKGFSAVTLVNIIISLDVQPSLLMFGRETTESDRKSASEALADYSDEEIIHSLKVLDNTIDMLKKYTEAKEKRPDEPSK